MSKLSNMLNMVLILDSGQKYSAKELADRLEVSERMVRTYKDDLEKAGIYVDTVKGKYGGYALNDELNEISIGLSKSDIAVFKELKEYIQSDSNFVLTKDYQTALNKILRAYERIEKSKETSYYGALDKGNNEKKKEVFTEAINAKQKVKVWYVSFTTKIRQRIIHPISLIKYKNSWFVLAFCETKGELRQFNFSRIIKYEIMKEKYENIDIELA